MKIFRCPVCDGSGKVYDNSTSGTDINTIICQSCYGKGYVVVDGINIRPESMEKQNCLNCKFDSPKLDGLRGICGECHLKCDKWQPKEQPKEDKLVEVIKTHYNTPHSDGFESLAKSVWEFMRNELVDKDDCDYISKTILIRIRKAQGEIS